MANEFGISMFSCVSEIVCVRLFQALAKCHSERKQSSHVPLQSLASLSIISKEADTTPLDECMVRAQLNLIVHFRFSVVSCCPDRSAAT